MQSFSIQKQKKFTAPQEEKKKSKYGALRKLATTKQCISVQTVS